MRVVEYEIYEESHWEDIALYIYRVMATDDKGKYVYYMMFSGPKTLADIDQVLNSDAKRRHILPWLKNSIEPD